jgi:hypothetical protein
MARSIATMHARPGDARKGGALLSRLQAAVAKRQRMDDAGVFNLAIVWTLVGFIIVVTVLAAMIGPVFTATADVNEALTDENVTTGDASADTIKPVFGIVIGLAVVLGVVGLVLAAIKFGGKK